MSSRMAKTVSFFKEKNVDMFYSMTTSAPKSMESDNLQ